MESSSSESSLYLSSSEDDQEEEEEVKIYDGNGEEVNLVPNSRKVQSKVPLIRRRGKRGNFSLVFRCCCLHNPVLKYSS